MQNTNTTPAIPTTLVTRCGNHISITDETRQHLLAHPEAAELLEEAVAKVELPESGFLLTSVDMGREIGLNGCLPANGATTTFAFRKGRDVPSRVLVGVEKESTSLFTIIAGRQDDGNWLLYTSFAGPSAPREPHDSAVIDNNHQEIEFWTQNGLVYDENVMGPVFESNWKDVIGYVRVMRAMKAEAK